ncbi:beta strand repeat-containing protein, partial [Pararhizobium sp. DWP1-1-3]|uniref:beta strand repeat-containing protein n=1 Tax=Pararhizobium sp. DWP1-1-3 TaxID=2804652 RepID=UPI003CF312E7
MSIEDLNISAIDADQSASEFSLEFQDDGRQATDIEMAQATDNGASSKSARLPAEVAAAGERPKEIVPDQNNIARLPADVTVDEIRVDGANLILVQADGTEVTIVNGALRIPTFIIGDVEVPQQVLLAVLEQDGVNVAAGPDGSYSATGSGPQSSGGNFEDTLQQSTQEAGPLADLLANTEFGDPNGDGNGLLFDDTPIITETALSFITETANADGTFENQTIDGIFGFVPGADTGQIASIAYVNTLNIDEPTQTGFATALTSGGAAVVVTVSADGLTLTGTAGGAVVFTLTVTNTATGAFTFQQLHALDHPDQGQSGADDLLRLQFTYTVTDKDGDTVIGNASIDIRDDGPVANVGTGSTVEDESVNGGNNEADGFTAGISGVSLNINWGADSANLGGANDRSVAFTNTTVAVSGASSTALTSLGLTVSTVLINGVLVGYTGDTAPTAITGEGSSNVVFLASVSDVANGSYDFTLVKPLDHAAGDGTNGENSLSLTFNYTATDSDGDKSSNTFTVGVIDDAPVANVGTGSTVEDEAVNGGNNEPDDLLSAAVTGVSLNINWGSDNANAGGLNDRSVAFTNATVAVSGAHGATLTSLGLTVSTVLINGVLVGYTGDTAPTAITGEGSSNVVFFASVSDVANGSYDFTLVKPLDHAAGDGANGENNLSLTFNYTATDSDGDKSSNTFTVGVIDDAPVANVGTGSTVEDEAVNGGNNEDDDFSAAVTGVSLNINWGSDNANAGGLNDRSVAFTNATVAVSGASSTALTSLGLAVTTTVLPDGTLVGYTGPTAPTALTGEGSGNLVFFAKVSDVANGSYDFTLVKPLDHAAGDGTNGENSLSLTFNYTATDSDGDKSSNTFTVGVIDDAPVANVGTGSTVEDEAVNGGNNEDDDFSAAVTGVSLNINWGSDNANAGGLNDRSVAFTNATVAVSGAHGATLTSLGLAVTTTVLPDGTLVGYTGPTAPTALTGEGSGNLVFFAKVSDVANGSYDFTLVKPLDHAAGDGTNGENSLSLTFNYTATDSDGDIAKNTFKVNVIDDVPVRGEEVRGTAEDEAVNGGNNESDGLTAVATGALNIRWGADNADSDLGGNGDRSVAFTATNNTPA